MTRIVVSPPKLQLLGMHLERKSDTLALMASQLQNSLNNLDWETRQKANIDEQVNAGCRQAINLSTQLDALSQFVQTKAQAFDDADLKGAADLTLFFEEKPVPEIKPPDSISDLPSFFQGFTGMKSILKTLKLIWKKNKLLKGLSFPVEIVDLFVTLLKLEKPFLQWEKYIDSGNFNPYIAKRYEQDAFQALKDVNFSSIQDRLDDLIKVLPKTTEIQKIGEDIADFLRVIQSWLKTVGEK